MIAVYNQTPSGSRCVLLLFVSKVGFCTLHTPLNTSVLGSRS